MYSFLIEISITPSYLCTIPMLHISVINLSLLDVHTLKYRLYTISENIHEQCHSFCRPDYQYQHRCKETLTWMKWLYRSVNSSNTDLSWLHTYMTQQYDLFFNFHTPRTACLLITLMALTAGIETIHIFTTMSNIGTLCLL